jgi:hypothetical protein
MKIFIGVSIAALLAHSAIARADDETAARAFQRGQAALKAKQIREACEAFTTSERLEPKLETELAVADCYGQEGKVATAAKMYRSAAENDRNAARAKKSNEKAARLEAKAPKLHFTLGNRPKGMVIKVDGVEVDATADVPVDFGPHEIVASAPTFEDATSSAIADGSEPVVEVRLLLLKIQSKPAEVKPEPAPEPKPEAKPEPKRESEPQPLTTVTTTAQPSHRRRNGIIIGSAGLGLVATAGVLFGVAASKFSTERDLCPNRMCANPTDLARANALLDNGTTMRNIGIGVGIGGVALMAVGGYLMFTSPKEAPRLSAQVTNDSTTLTFSSSF